MPQGSPSGLQQIQRMQGMQWGDGRTDYHLWLDGDRLYTDAKFSGVVNSSTAGSAAAASLGVIGTVTIPANTLGVDGKVLRVRAWGQFASNNNAKGAQLFTTTVVQTLGQTGTQTANNNGGSWSIDVTVQRRSAAVVTFAGLGTYSNGALTQGGTVTVAGVVAFDTSIAQTIQVSAIPSLITDGDVTFLGMIVEVVN